MTPFAQWVLRAAKVTDDPVGDFIADARVDSYFPPMLCSWMLAEYMLGRGACREALDAVPDILRRYETWSKRRSA